MDTYTINCSLANDPETGKLTDLNHTMGYDHLADTRRRPVSELLQNWRDGIHILATRLNHNGSYKLHLAISNSCNNKVVIYNYVLRKDDSDDISLGSLIVVVSKDIIVKTNDGTLLTPPLLCTINEDTDVPLKLLKRFGATTKRNNNDENDHIVEQMGQHGEGLKIAALNALRQGSKLTYITHARGNYVSRFVPARETKENGNKRQTIIEPSQLRHNDGLYHEHAKATYNGDKRVIAILENIPRDRDRTISRSFSERDYLFLYQDLNRLIRDAYAERVCNEASTIIFFDRSMQGRIYEGGFFLRYEPKLIYGVNIGKLNSGRGRRVEDPDVFGPCVLEHWFKGVCEDETILERFYHLLNTHANAHELQEIFALDNPNIHAVTKIADRFFKDHPNTFPYNGSDKERLLATLVLRKPCTEIISQPLLKLLYKDLKISAWIANAPHACAKLRNSPIRILDEQMNDNITKLVRVCTQILNLEPNVLTFEVHTNVEDSALAIKETEEGRTRVLLNEDCLRSAEELSQTVIDVLDIPRNRIATFFHNLLQEDTDNEDEQSVALEPAIENPVEEPAHEEHGHENVPIQAPVVPVPNQDTLEQVRTLLKRHIDVITPAYMVIKKRRGNITTIHGDLTSQAVLELLAPGNGQDRTTVSIDTTNI